MSAPKVNSLLLRRNTDGTYTLDVSQIGIDPLHTIALQNWVAAGPLGNRDTPVYYRDPFGIVRLQGGATFHAGAGSVIGSLPAGYRPPRTLFIPVDVWSGADSVQILQVQQGGDLVIDPALIQFNTTVYFDPISFRAA